MQSFGNEEMIQTAGWVQFETFSNCTTTAKAFSYSTHVVPVPEYFLFCIPHCVHLIQYRGVDISAHKKTSSHHAWSHCAVVVCAGHMVRVGLLCLHRLALDGKGKIGVS
jgi:hypothetical protein